MATLWTRQPRSVGRTEDGEQADGVRPAASEVGRRPRARSQGRGGSVRASGRRRRVKLLSVPPSVRLQCSNDDARSASEARLGPGVILGLKFRERSGAKIWHRGGAPHGRPRTADGEKVGVAIQSTGRGGRRPWRRAAGRRAKVEGSPFLDGDAGGEADFGRCIVE